MPPRKVKAPKDPNAPKRAQSSYFLFSNERRAPLMGQYPEKRITDISKLISVEWKAMTPEDKKKYENNALTEKAAYKIKLDAYKLTHEYTAFQKKLADWKATQKDMANGIQKGKGKGNQATKGGYNLKPPKKPKDKNAPKKPQSSYFQFQNAQRSKFQADNPTLKITEIAKLLCARWKELTPEEKRPYEVLATEAKAKYQIIHATYLTSEEYKAYQVVLSGFETLSKQYLDDKRRYEEKQARLAAQESESDSDDDSSSSSSSSSGSSSSGSSSSGSSSSSSSSDDSD